MTSKLYDLQLFNVSGKSAIFNYRFNLMSTRIQTTYETVFFVGRSARQYQVLKSGFLVHMYLYSDMIIRQKKSIFDTLRHSHFIEKDKLGVRVSNDIKFMIFFFVRSKKYCAPVELIILFTSHRCDIHMLLFGFQSTHDQSYIIYT